MIYLVDSLGKDDADRKQYAITPEGDEELRSWLLKPVERSICSRFHSFTI